MRSPISASPTSRCRRPRNASGARFIAMVLFQAQIPLEHNSRNRELISKRTPGGDTMTDLRVVTAEGSDAILEDAAVQDFAADLRGKLLQPGDGEYDAARIVWNGMI